MILVVLICTLIGALVGYPMVGLIVGLLLLALDLWAAGP